MKKITRRSFPAILCVCSLLLTATPAGAAFIAQWPDIFGYDFRFNNPGARANGMGGAFIGLADDATAAYANPAGLTILTKAEVSLEYKYGKYTNLIYDPILSGSVLGHKDVEYEDTVQGPSFISFVYPKDDATFAVYRHKLIGLKTNFSFLKGSPDSSFDVDLEIDANTTGFGLGVKMSPWLSVGMSANFTELALDEHTIGHEGPFNDAYEEGNGTDQAVHYTASILLQPFESLSVGIVYRQGPKFTTRKKGYYLTQTVGDYNGDGVVDFNDYDTNGDGVFDASDSPNYVKTYTEWYNFEHEIKVPDFYGLGIAYRPLPNLTTTVDVNYIEYSDLVADISGGTDPDALTGFTINNRYELHAGVEYVLDLGSKPLAMRCGYYYRPEHRFHIDESHPDYSLLNKIYPKGEDEQIYSLGFGTLLMDNVQIDMAGSYGKFTREATVSLVYRFE